MLMKRSRFACSGRCSPYLVQIISRRARQSRKKPRAGPRASARRLAGIALQRSKRCSKRCVRNFRKAYTFLALFT